MTTTPRAMTSGVDIMGTSLPPDTRENVGRRDERDLCRRVEPTGGTGVCASRASGTRPATCSTCAEGMAVMTVPEENRKKTDTTDEVIGEGAGTEASSEPGAATGRTMRQAMEDAG